MATEAVFLPHIGNTTEQGTQVIRLASAASISSPYTVLAPGYVRIYTATTSAVGVGSGATVTVAATSEYFGVSVGDVVSFT